MLPRASVHCSLQRIFELRRVKTPQCIFHMQWKYDIFFSRVFWQWPRWETRRRSTCGKCPRFHCGARVRMAPECHRSVLMVPLADGLWQEMMWRWQHKCWGEQKREATWKLASAQLSNWGCDIWLECWFEIMAVRDQWGTPPHKLDAGSKRCTQANNTNGISWSNNVENNSRISSPGISGTKSTYLSACSCGRTALLTITNEKLIYFPCELHDLQKLVGPYQQERGLKWSLVQKLREDWDKSNLQIVISNLSKMLCPELWQDDKIDHMTSCWHWLPVTSRTVFKLLLWPTRSSEAQLHFLWRS